MIEPQIFEINIAFANKENNLSENFFYQKFNDYDGKKVREVIRTINEFPSEKGFSIHNPQLTIAFLDGMTKDAQALAEQTGQSINWELLKILNNWLFVNT